eukprot:COSAG02_NODE_23408_length_719_cov_4.354839_1_plen_103_part_01
MVGITQDAAEERDDGAARASSPSPTNLRASRKHNAHACGGTNSWLVHTAAGSNGLLRVVGTGEAVAVVVARRGTTTEATRESSRSGFGALKSTGSRRRVPRSA